MKNKNIFCAACAFFSPLLYGGDTVSANITLHIAERMNLTGKTLSSIDTPNPELASAFFCVGLTSGLQFSIEGDDPTSRADLKLAVGSTPNKHNMARNGRVNECHERNSGVLQITQLPQGARTITAVVVAE